MKAPTTIVGTLLDIAWVRDPAKRRLAIAALAVVLAVLSVWPRHYVARADLMPDDTGGGLSSLLSATGGSTGLLSLGALLGSHQSIEADLSIARSQAVVADVVRRLRLEGRPDFGGGARAQVKLRHKVDIEAIRGSILQITVRDRDPAFAKALTSGYVAAIRGRLTDLNLSQAAQKRAVATNRMRDAETRLANAQDAITRFRTANKLAAPEIQLAAGVQLVTALQARLQAGQAELQTLLHFATGDNVEVQAARAEVASLQSQIADAQAASAGATNLGGMSLKISEYTNLYRDEKVAEALYEIYKRYLDTVTVDELSATTNMDVIEPPFVDPQRQYNVSAVGGLVLVLLFGLLAEFYIIRPPPGRRPMRPSDAV